MSLIETSGSLNRFFASGYESCKNTAFSCGRKITAGFSDHVVPAMKSAWEAAKPVLLVIGNFFRTGFGLGSLCFTAGITFRMLAGYSENSAKRFVLNALAIAAFVGAGALMACGTAVLL